MLLRSVFCKRHVIHTVLHSRFTINFHAHRFRDRAQFHNGEKMKTIKNFNDARVGKEEGEVGTDFPWGSHE